MSNWCRRKLAWAEVKIKRIKKLLCCGGKKKSEPTVSNEVLRCAVDPIITSQPVPAQYSAHSIDSWPVYRTDIAGDIALMYCYPGIRINHSIDAWNASNLLKEISDPDLRDAFIASRLNIVTYQLRQINTSG